MHALRLTLICIVCAGLGFGVALWWPSSEPQLRERRLLEAAASSIVRVELPGGLAERTGVEDWVVTRGHGTDEALQWPGDRVRLRALTRLLSSAVAISGGDDEEKVGGGPRVSIRLGESDERVLEFARSAVGGRVAVRVIGPDEASSWTGVVDAEVLDLFTGGVDAWLSLAAMPSAPLEPARVELEGVGGGVLLDRLGARWVMREPVTAECEAGLVALAMRQLAALSGERLLWTPPATDAVATWTVVDARRSGRTWKVELFETPGELLATARCSVLGAEGEVVWGPVLMAMDGSESERIDPTASAYLSRRTLRGAPADLAELSITRGEKTIGLTRDPTDLNGWTDSSGREHPEATALLEMLMDSVALAAVPSAAFESGFTPEFEASIGGVQAVQVGIYEAEGQSRVATSDGEVLRVYDTGDARTAWQWLDSLFASSGP